MSSARRIALMTLLHTLGLVLVALILVITVYGRDNSWKLAFGDPDLGHVDFATLRKGPNPNEWLVAPPERLEAAPDAVAPVFAMAAPDLFARLLTIAEAEPRTTRVGLYPQQLEARFVQRTEWMRFPDTIVVKVYELEPGRAAVALYSRSQIGRSDFGVNRARIERWLAALAAAAPPVGLAALSYSGSSTQ